MSEELRPDDRSDLQLTKDTFKSLGVPFIQTKSAPPVAPEESHSVSAIVIGKDLGESCVWFCFNTAGNYTGVVLPDGSFAPVGQHKKAVTFHDILPDYKTYVDLQKGKYCSHEITVPQWEEGQKRYIEATFTEVPRNVRILDVACGDGVGLRQFKALGFTNVVGVEFNEVKLAKARESGYRVVGRDMHDLSCFGDHSFNVIYSSHTLEHAYKPSDVLAEFHRILVEGGCLLVVLPYPDKGDWNDKAHGAKYELGTDVPDNGASIIRYFESHRFKLLARGFDNFREPEIWLSFQSL